MRSRSSLLACAFALTLTVSVAAPATTGAAPSAPQAAQTYIVVLDDSVGSSGAVATEHRDEFGANVRGVYSHALKGYSARLTEAEVARLRADHAVDFVVEEQMFQLQVQTVPTGIQRIFADDNPNIGIDGQDDARIDVDVAVLDSGSGPHPDLNVVDRVNCSSGSCVPGGNDDNGHGTHVAGTIGAIDNDEAVVGVAPGARLHSIKACNSQGQCPSSAIVAGVDYIAARADTIEVTNISLGGPGTDPATAAALADAVDAGVVFAVAAGNSNENAAGFSPANHPDVITVSALADFNGAPGGGAGATCRADQDDTLADFSNFGSTVEVAAPGVCILSTWLNGGTNTISGTSMATPHVAGAAALLTSGPRDPTSRAEALAVRQRIIETGNLAWTDDSGDGVEEPLLDVGDSAEYPGGDESPPPEGEVVFADDFEAATGWTANPAASDTAATGEWQAANPEATSYQGSALQLGETTSGSNDLVTAASAGTDVGANDIDGGVTSIESPAITLPGSGTIGLSARYYLAHLSNATDADLFRISVVAGGQTTTVFEQLGAASVRPATWGQATADLTPFAGQSVRILIQAADNATGSLVEAAVDDLTITAS